MPSSTASKHRFGRVHTRTLKHQVLEQIRNAILFGQLGVGERLVEAEIAAQMGISRVPVREALCQLEQEGLVVSTPHRGTVVAGVDEDEIDLLYTLRAELEGWALRRAAARDPGDLAARLQFLVETMRTAVRARDLTQLAEGDLRFHQTIVARSGYHVLNRVWSSMDGQIRARIYRCLMGPFREDLIWYTAESHQPIVDALAARDVEGAVVALRQHILETRRLIEEGVRGAGERQA